MPHGPAIVPAVFVGMGIAGILGLLLALFIAAVFLWMAAKLIGVENASVGKAMIAIVGGGILATVVGGVVGAILDPLGPLAVFITNLWVIKAVFDTDWIRAFLAWLLSAVIAALVVIILVLFGVLTLGAL